MKQRCHPSASQRERPQEKPNLVILDLGLLVTKTVRLQISVKSPNVWYFVMTAVGNYQSTYEKSDLNISKIAKSFQKLLCHTVSDLCPCIFNCPTEQVNCQYKHPLAEHLFCAGYLTGLVSHPQINSTR